MPRLRRRTENEMPVSVSPSPKTAANGRRGDMALRTVAAVPLAYVLSSLAAMAFARLLPGERSEAAVAATLLAFVVYAMAAMWAFAARSGWRALWSVAAAAALFGAAAWISILSTGRL